MSQSEEVHFIILGCSSEGGNMSGWGFDIYIHTSPHPKKQSTSPTPIHTPSFLARWSLSADSRPNPLLMMEVNRQRDNRQPPAVLSHPTYYQLNGISRNHLASQPSTWLLITGYITLDCVPLNVFSTFLG